MVQVFSLIFIFVFFRDLSGIDLSSYIAFSIAIMTFVFSGDQSLKLIYVSKTKIVGLSFIYILMLLVGLIFVFLG